MAENCRRFQAASGAGAAAPCTSWMAGLCARVDVM